jgi:hypothetical protein
MENLTETKFHVSTQADLPAFGQKNCSNESNVHVALCYYDGNFICPVITLILINELS